MKVPVEILVVVCVAVGVVPALTVAPLVAAAASAMLGGRLPEYSIAIWHGVSAPLALSVAAFAGGAATYWALQRKYDLHLHVPSGWTGRLVFQRALDGLAALAARVTDGFENGRLQRSLVAMFATAAALGAVALAEGVARGPRPLVSLTPLAVVGALVLAGAALGCVAWHRRRLAAMILAAVAGLVVSLAFLYLSAPDLALTQLSVEVVSTVLLLLALGGLPQRGPAESSALRKGRDAALAAALGIGVGCAALAAMTRPLDSISWYFIAHSVPGGGGANMVNVILVDFRGYDTFGEIAVLAIAALGVAAVMQGVRLAGRAGPPPAPPLLLMVTARWLLPLALTVAVYLFLRGHNAPGGGFVAGLVTAAALVMHRMAQGAATVPRRVDYARLAGVGLLVAGATGVGAWAAGKPFLASAHGHPVVPVLGELPLASAALFDLGVYLVVVGATLLALNTLAAAGRPTGEA
jgi:multicomponent K+:H+ antiporter subunit A